MKQIGQFDDLIHQPIRLKIMATLKGLPEDGQIEFVRLRAIVGATEGNLGAHIASLEKAGYLTMTKDFLGKKPRSRVQISQLGRRAFDSYIGYLRDIVDQHG